MRCPICLVAAVATVMWVTFPLRAAEYYVDFDGGKDSAAGTSADQAWKHSPGDPAAEGGPKAAKLGPGDTVLFKGSVVYRGTIAIGAGGAEGKPLVFDGNSGRFGQGRAIIDGSQDLVGWRPCASAEECAGNPNWKNIYWAPAPKGAGVFTINLCEGNVTLPIAQDPKPADPFFEDVVSSYRPVIEPKPADISGVRIIPGKGMAENPSRKYILMVSGNLNNSAILDPLVGAELTFRPAKPATITAVGIALADPKVYPPPTEIAFLIDGNEVLRVTVEAKQGLQKFSLAGPVAMKELTFKVLSAKDGGKPVYGAVASLEAYDQAGQNVLLGSPRTIYRDPNCFTQKDPHAWDGAYFALHGRPNMIYYQKVFSYDPNSSTITMDMLTADQYPTKGDTIGRYSMMNALAILSRPGEFVLDERPRADGTQRVWLWPLEAPQGAEGLRGVTYSVQSSGFTINGASYVTIHGFLIRKQGGNPRSFGITGGGATDILIRENEVTLVRAERNQVIGISDADRVTIAGNYVHECRRAGAIALTRCRDSLISNNRLHKNGATCLLMYYSHNIRAEHNVLTDHKGMHANGLTAYLNCSGITFAYNRVSGGSAPITLQEGEDILVHHNIFDGGVMGLWGVATLKNARFCNNLFLHSDPNSTWALSIYCGGAGPMVGYEFRNNVIDGIYRESDIVAVHDHNVYTRPGVAGAKTNTWKMGEAEVVEPDLKKIFVAPEKDDYHPKPGGPLDGTGVDIGLNEDIAGAKTPQGKPPCIGAYEK